AEGPRAGAGVQQRAQAGLGVVAEEAADLVQAGRHRLAVQRHAHLAVVVAQVAVLRAGAEVDPLADVAVAEEAVVVLVDGPLQHAGLDLAADAAVRAEGGLRAHLGPQDVGVRADVAGAFQPAEGGDDRLVVDDHRAAPRVGHHHRIDVRRRVEQQLVGRADHGEARRPPGDRVPGRPLAEVVPQLLAVVLYHLPQMPQQPAAGPAGPGRLL